MTVQQVQQWEAAVVLLVGALAGMITGGLSGLVAGGAGALFGILCLGVAVLGVFALVKDASSTPATSIT